MFLEIVMRALCAIEEVCFFGLFGFFGGGVGGRVADFGCLAVFGGVRGVVPSDER